VGFGAETGDRGLTVDDDTERPTPEFYCCDCGFDFDAVCEKGQLTEVRGYRVCTRCLEEWIEEWNDWRVWS
jgi:hypothetical protein